MLLLEFMQPSTKWPLCGGQAHSSNVGSGCAPECWVAGSQPRYLSSTLITITSVGDQDTGHDDQVADFVDHENRFAHGALMTRGQAQAEVRRDGLTSCERIP